MSAFPQISEESKANIRYIFEDMCCEPGTESNSLAIEWLNKHDNYFAGFVDGNWIPKDENKTSPQTHKIVDPFTGKYLFDIALASEEVFNLATESSLKGQEKWMSLGDSHKRMCTLYSIAQSIERNSHLFALLESLSSGKHVHKTKTRDVPNLIESFYYYANFCDQYEDKKPLGVICVIAEEFNNPLMSISWRVSSILAAGNALVLLVDMKSCLSAFFLAEICNLCGLPPGVLNVLPVDQGNLTSLPRVSKVIFTGSFVRGRKVAQLAGDMKIPCDLSITRRPVVIIYDSADLHTAVNGVLDYLFFNDARSESGGCKVFIQESVYEKVVKLLKKYVLKIKLGSNFTKTDMSGIITEEQKKTLNLFMEDAINHEAKIVQTSEVYKTGYPSWAPLLLYDITAVSKFLNEEIGGPVIVTISFRTAKESITMFNLNNLGADVSVWSDKLAVALEIAQELKSGTVWINCQNLFTAATAYVKGNSIEGSQYALLMHLASVMDDDIITPVTKSVEENIESAEKSTESTEESTEKGESTEESTEKGESTEKSVESSNEEVQNQQNYLTGNQVYDHFIGGSYKRPSTSSLIHDKNNQPYAYIADGNSSDVQAAISSALGGLPKWKQSARHKRSQILITIAENLHERKKEFASYLEAIIPHSYESCMNEVEASINCLFFWASQATKYYGKIKATSDGVKVFEELDPVGIIGIHCPNVDPLLSFLSRIAPAIAFGNAIIIIPSEKYPVPALIMCEIFRYSDVPSGMINVITGPGEALMSDLSAQVDVNTVWFSSRNQAAACIPGGFCSKRSFIYGSSWSDSDKIHKTWKLMLECTRIKTVFLPIGDIFAN